MSDQPENPAPAQEEQPKDAADAQETPAAEQQDTTPEGGAEEKKDSAGAEGGTEEKKEPADAEGGAEEKKEPAGAEGGAEEKKEGEQAQVTEQKEGISCSCNCGVKLLLESHNACLQERRLELRNQSPPSDPSLCGCK